MEWQYQFRVVGLLESIQGTIRKKECILFLA
jgi:hypothetical protein